MECQFFLGVEQKVADVECKGNLETVSQEHPKLDQLSTNIVVKKKSFLLNFLMMKHPQNSRQLKQNQTHPNSKGVAVGVGTELFVEEDSNIEVDAVKMKCSAEEADVGCLHSLAANCEEVVVSY